MFNLGSFWATLLTAIQEFFANGIVAWLTQLFNGLLPTS
jgi:hypothetical protein